MTVLEKIIAKLKKQYGKARNLAPTSNPWNLILWENAAYLVDDERRKQTWDLLQKKIGIDPQKILHVSEKKLCETIQGGGMKPAMRAQKLKKCAKIMQDVFGGSLQRVVQRPLKEAIKDLTRFPSIGEPGAEKILLFCKTHPVFALESNGLRVLLRLGYGKEEQNYAVNYRTVRKNTAAEIKKDCAWLTQAHLLLRQHGQELCKSSKPKCAECPLSMDCSFIK